MTAAHDRGMGEDHNEHWEQWGSEDDPAISFPEEEETDSPYDYNLDLDAGAHVSDEDLKAQLNHLPRCPTTPTPGMRAETLTVNQNAIASRVLHLQNRGVIMYTVDFYHSRDQFEEWVHDTIGRRMRIAVEQIKVLAKYTFLVVVSKPEARRTESHPTRAILVYGQKDGNGATMDC